MQQFDFIIIGAGSSGCVLADRLTRDPRHKVLLIEAGPPDRHPLITMPMGIGKLIFNRKFAWQITGNPSGGRNTPEEWHLGKTLGGSSSINGMNYVRGQPEDYDGWEAGGAKGWGWQQIGAAFRAIEDHELGEGPWRGVGGPFHVGVRKHGDAIGEAIIAAGEAFGLRRKEDMNDIDQEGVGYFARNIYRGRRWSAADAFLKPARRRPNLTIVSGTQVDRILFEGTRATGVACRGPAGPITYHAGREIILSAGTLHSPRLLQLCGIGPASLLKGRGVEVLIDSPGVGANLREHRSCTIQFRFDRRIGLNHQMRGYRLIANVLRYYALRDGPMSGPAFEVGAYLKSRPELMRPDIQIHAGAPSVVMANGKITVDDVPGMRTANCVMRPESQGTVAIRSADPNDTLDINPNFMSAEYDKKVAVDMVHRVRTLFAQKPMLDLGIQESTATADVRSDDEIVTHIRENGYLGHHVTGTCRMGEDAMAVVDSRLRVRGASGLRVLDCSVMPTMTSGNTAAPAMAIGWRGADLILEDHQG